MQFGWKWPFYGAVFFSGEIEHSQSTVWRDIPDDLMRIGINLEGIHVIDDKKSIVKLSLPYDKLRYNSWEDSTSGDSCFMIEFEVADAPALAPKKSKKDAAEPYQKHTVVIWTQQAGMIDTLATRYISQLDKWHEYLDMKAAEKGQSQVARGDVSNRRACEPTKHFPSIIDKWCCSPARHRPDIHAQQVCWTRRKASREQGWVYAVQVPLQHHKAWRSAASSSQRS